MRWKFPKSVKKHFNVRVSGRVQGVLFRDSAMREARKFGLKGFVRNEPDGSVYIEVEGDEPDVRRFLDWCGQGPNLAKVEKVENREGEFRNFKNFSVL